MKPTQAHGLRLFIVSHKSKSYQKNSMLCSTATTMTTTASTEPFPEVPGYCVTGKLGDGSDSQVFACYRKGTKNGAPERFAAKVVCKRRDRRWIKEEVAARERRSRMEIRVLELLKGVPHVVSMHEWFETDEALYIILEFAEGGDLFDALYGSELNPTTQIDEEQARR